MNIQPLPSLTNESSSSNDSGLKFIYPDGLVVNFPATRRPSRKSLVISKQEQEQAQDRVRGVHAQTQEEKKKKMKGKMHATSRSCPNFLSFYNNKKEPVTDTFGLYVPFPKDIPLRRKLRREYIEKFGSSMPENNIDQEPDSEEGYGHFHNISQHGLSSYKEEEEVEEKTENENENEPIDFCSLSNAEKIRTSTRRKIFQKRLSDGVASSRKTFSGFSSCAKRASRVLKVLDAVQTPSMTEDEMVERFTKSIFTMDLSGATSK